MAKLKTLFFLALDVLMVYFYIYPLWNVVFWIIFVPFCLVNTIKLWRYPEARQDWIRFKNYIPAIRIVVVIFFLTISIVSGQVLSTDDVFKLAIGSSGLKQGFAWIISVLTYIVSILYMVVMVDDLINFIKSLLPLGSGNKNRYP